MDALIFDVSGSHIKKEEKEEKKATEIPDTYVLDTPAFPGSFSSCSPTGSSNSQSYSQSPINVALDLPPTMSGSSASDADSVVTPLAVSNFRTYGVMPRPGQPGALHFDKTNISEILRRWNNECEDFGLTDVQKCTRLPDYCAAETRETIELLSGYEERDWLMLQTKLKGYFWQHDKQKDTTESLNELVQDASAMDLNVYLLKHASISNALVKEGALSTLDHVNHFLDRLYENLHDRALEFCTKKSWRLSSHDTGTKDPVFDELKDFIKMKAEVVQKKTVYDKEYSIRHSQAETPITMTAPFAFPTPTATPVQAATPTVAPPPAPTQVLPTPDSIAELTRQFSQLALAMQANIQPRPPAANAPAVSALAPRPPRCT